MKRKMDMEISEEIEGNIQKKIKRISLKRKTTDQQNQEEEKEEEKVGPMDQRKRLKKTQIEGINTVVSLNLDTRKKCLETTVKRVPKRADGKVGKKPV